jgi:glyoxylase-like metal-dependent hydrolase (beta-lactamase superfamily II)
MKIQRVLANNPGPYTGPGTNTWILDDGHGAVVVIDPGPVDSRHYDEVVRVVDNRMVEAVLVTHTHVDHAPMANPMAGDLGVPAIGYGPGSGFVPDLRLIDGDSIEVGMVSLDVIHTPGHAEDHLCFRVENALFTGDHIMGGSSVMVESLRPYLDSLEKLRGTGLTCLHPGHGAEIDDPDAVIDWYLAHRRQRHDEIFGAIQAGAGTVADIVDFVYADVDSSLHPLAALSVTAHVALLNEEGRIALEGNHYLVAPQTI